MPIVMQTTSSLLLYNKTCGQSVFSNLYFTRHDIVDDNNSYRDQLWTFVQRMRVFCHVIIISEGTNATPFQILLALFKCCWRCPKLGINGPNGLQAEKEKPVVSFYDLGARPFLRL